MESAVGANWRTLFAVKNVEPKLRLRIPCHFGSGRCGAAKKFRCTCQCNHKNHGSRYKDAMTRLDGVLEEAE